MAFGFMSSSCYEDLFFVATFYLRVDDSNEHIQLDRSNKLDYGC